MQMPPDERVSRAMAVILLGLSSSHPPMPMEKEEESIIVVEELSISEARNISLLSQFYLGMSNKKEMLLLLMVMDGRRKMMGYIIHQIDGRTYVRYREVVSV
jgi:hypothetical protein